MMNLKTMTTVSTFPYVNTDLVDYWVEYEGINLHGTATVSKAVECVFNFLENNKSSFINPSKLDVGFRELDDGDWLAWINPESYSDDYIDVDDFLDGNISGDCKTIASVLRKYYLDLVFSHLSPL